MCLAVPVCVIVHSLQADSSILEWLLLYFRRPKVSGSWSSELVENCYPRCAAAAIAVLVRLLFA